MGRNARIFDDFAADAKRSVLPDFSYAGYGYGEKPIPGLEASVNVRDFGIVPDTGEDLTERIGQLIDTVGASGGGVILFPRGRYELNGDPERPGGIAIDHSRIVLRGEGSGKDGTVFCKRRPLLHKAQPWLSPGIIHTGGALFGNDRFLSPRDLPQVAQLAAESRKGDRILQLTDASQLAAGDCILLCMRNTDDEGSLIRSMLAPFEPDPKMKDAFTAGVRRTNSYQWLAEVERVLDGRRILLRQPLRRDLPLRYEPFVCRMPMLTEIGIEHIRLESAWDGGGYYHHKNPEVDYGWSGICLHRVAHGWVRDVAVDNYTQGVQLRDSRNVTVRDVAMYGHPGHYGMKCYAHACDNLFADIALHAFLTHGVGIEGTTQGNVFTRIRFLAEGTEIDLHGGGAPSANLFDRFLGVAKLSGGGAIANLPHSGHHNTFWNIGYRHAPARHNMNTYWREERMVTSAENEAERLDELFFAWYRSYKQELDTLQDHHLYPKSIVVGAHACDPERVVRIERCVSDRDDEWIYAEGLNERHVGPESLYRAQLELRLAQA
ncbi:DUF4955 domain-containing protein [Paenibacillus cymbidii]|uniref:DUF4955 domain-containing protein n=1 Tax=Paenibacillus cymbidii TaxID=1639034 RepID=UPI001080A4E6|nr:DUF4955 domain-containing protein [Paenibacillus cymbidii]